MTNKEMNDWWDEINNMPKGAEQDRLFDLYLKAVKERLILMRKVYVVKESLK